jgi:hypothetical protein
MALGAKETYWPGSVVTDEDGRLILVSPGAEMGPLGSGETYWAGSHATDEYGRAVAVGPGGSSLEFGAAAATGTASRDTAAIKAVFQAAAKANGVAVFNKPGVYKINEELVRPNNISIVGGPNVTFQAVAPFTGTCLLTDPAHEKTVYQSISGGMTLDSNNVANHALWCRYFGHLTLGVICQNSLEDDCILGDTEATEASYEAYLQPAFAVNRNAGSVPVGHYCLWAKSCSDGRMFGNTFKGQEVGIRTDLGDWKGFGVHPYGAGFPMQVGIEDRAGNEWIGVCGDTLTPSTHAEATGESAKSTITDPAILGAHEGRPVTGTNIPAEAYVGGVTAGTSFQLVNGLGEAIKPAGAVAGISLLGAALILRGSGFAKVIGGSVINNVTYGSDKGSVGVAIGRNISGGYVQGFHSKGGSSGKRMLKALVGKLSVISYFGMVEENTAEKVEPRSQFV